MTTTWLGRSGQHLFNRSCYIGDSDIKSHRLKPIFQIKIEVRQPIIVFRGVLFDLSRSVRGSFSRYAILRICPSHTYIFIFISWSPFFIVLILKFEVFHAIYSNVNRSTEITTKILIFCSQPTLVCTFNVRPSLIQVIKLDWKYITMLHWKLYWGIFNYQD